jgi:hypothetical protein
MDQHKQVDDAGTKPWTWILPDGHASGDWIRYRRRLETVAAGRGFELETLGTACAEPLLMLRGGANHPSAPRLLVASGFHGEEPAGPWGVLEFLETADQELLSRVRLTVLPLVNVTGFRAGTRFNLHGENPNRGYLGLPGENPSHEGQLLLAHPALLLEAARDGLLTCHEDVLLSHGYVYGNERAAAPGAFSRMLLAANAAHFPVHPDGTVDGCPITGGIVFNHHDGSFESWLMELGIARAACVETPGQHPIERRIAAQRAMIEAFLDCAPPAGH